MLESGRGRMQAYTFIEGCIRRHPIGVAVPTILKISLAADAIAGCAAILYLFWLAVGYVIENEFADGDLYPYEPGE